MVAITMRGSLEAIILDEDFASTVNALNLASAKGQSFVVAAIQEDRHIAMKIENILTISELDDEANSLA